MNPRYEGRPTPTPFSNSMMPNGFYAPLTTTTELKKNANYDESDDEEDVGLDSRGTAAQPLPAKAGLRLPEKVSEGDVELESDDLREVLTDTPIVKKAQVATVVVEGDGQSELTKKSSRAGRMGLTRRTWSRDFRKNTS